MSACGEVGSDVQALIKELAIIRVEHRSKIHSNVSQHLAEGKEVARLRRRFSFILHQAPSFRTRHHRCRQEVAFAGIQDLRSEGLVSVPAHSTVGVTGSEGREEMNGVGGGIEVRSEIGDGNEVGVGNGDDVNSDGDRDATGRRTG